MSFGVVPPQVQDVFSFRVRATIKPVTSGHHAISLASIGPAELFLDGIHLIERSGAFEEKGSLFFTYGSNEKVISMNFEARRE
jgi:beta-glucosidase